METLGTFKDVETATKAVDSLVKAGFSEETITSLTSAPYPDGVIVKTDQRTWFRWVSVGGGIFGACAGFLLAAGTAYVYPVQTGDKPIIASYPTGIIMYELTMLFAILGAIVGMFLEMKLPPRDERVYDPAIGEGSIGISVTVDSREQMSRAGKLMEAAGALTIRH
ncbi:MAG TPA: quinol:electron acceptor oxidoreductase subunit ActD [Nitrospirota bacterium]|nr:quinol:electron acceptor oxidoreductase subunit ActD [Nitrospirota bacterium]